MLRKIKKILHKIHFSLLDWIIISSSIIGICVVGLLLFKNNKYITITVKVGEENVAYNPIGSRKWFSNFFTVGMKEINGFGKTEAEVLNVFSYNSEPNKKNVYLTVKINATYSRSSRQYVFKGKPVLIGSTIRMYLGSVLTDGLVTNINGVPDTRLKKSIIVETQVFGDTSVYPQTSGVNAHLADSVSLGDTIKDDQGNIKAKIVDKRLEDAKQLVTTSDGKMILTINPLKKDMYLTIEIFGYTQNGTLFMFDDIPILIDTVVPLHFPYVSLYPVVTKILKVE